MKRIRTASILLGMFIILSLSASLSLAQDDTVRPEGWHDYSHSNSTDPDYAVVFPQDEVNIVTFKISPDNWQAMLHDMTDIYGEFGARKNGGSGGGGRPPMGGDRPQGGGAQPPVGNGTGPDVGGAVFGNGQNPIWVTADLEFEDHTWMNVGIRFKGNSSLASSWSGGNYKLPFKLDFDEFEDDYPEINNQRFYGFQQLSFSSNWSDESLLREKVTADIFRDAGVPAAQTAFYAVYIDYGEGAVYFGLYTAVEVIEDTVIETRFADDSGNVYKPEGNGATFADGYFDEESFDKETNQDEADYSDILALFDVLHDETRTSDPATWRSNLEAVLDVDGFMLWLAVNSVAQNWDTYGRMAHNYYLYNDPSTGLLTWIPWDNNMALGDSFGGGRRGSGGQAGSSNVALLDHESEGENWPLIRYLMDDPVYRDLYITYVDEVSNGAFEPTRMEGIYQALHDLIAPYVIGENGENAEYTHLSSAEAFNNALTYLIEHVNKRYALAQEYVNSQTLAQ